MHHPLAVLTQPLDYLKDLRLINHLYPMLLLNDGVLHQGLLRESLNDPGTVGEQGQVCSKPRYSLIREFLTGARGPCHRFQRIHNEYTIEVSHSSGSSQVYIGP